LLRLASSWLPEIIFSYLMAVADLEVPRRTGKSEREALGNRVRIGAGVLQGLGMRGVGEYSRGV
jgi:hypothetical protein